MGCAPKLDMFATNRHHHPNPAYDALESNMANAIFGKQDGVDRFDNIQTKMFRLPRVKV